MKVNVHIEGSKLKNNNLEDLMDFDDYDPLLFSLKLHLG